MKQSTRNIFLSGSIALALFGSCKKDNGPDSKDLLVYVQGDYGSTNNSIVASLIQTPVATRGNTTFLMSAYSTRQVAADVNVYLYPDDKSVDAFNLFNNKKCLLLPATAYQIDANQHKIAAGAMISDPLQIKITNPGMLTDTNGYVLPLTVEKIDGRDKGVTISSNRATAYLYIPYSFTNVDTMQTIPAGTLADRTGWSVTVSNTTNGALGPAMLDGNDSTVWRSSNSSTAAKYVVLNMGTAQTVKGLQLGPDYTSTGENATKINVSTSSDSTTWTVQGTWTGTGPAAGSSFHNPDIKGINFIAPVTAKYVRLDIVTWVSGSRAGIAELNAIQ